MKKRQFFPFIYVVLLLSISSNIVLAQSVKQEFPLWPKGVPNAIASSGYKEKHDVKNDHISSVSIPTLTVFVPAKPNGTSVVICPGGAYAILSIKLEGYSVAEWLNSFGVTAFVLKNRLPDDSIMTNKTIGPLQDAQEAIRFVRRNAAKWNLDQNKIGIIGFSAGGHLAASASTLYRKRLYPVPDNVSARPDFSILIYPVISMTDNVTHLGSRYNLLGAAPTPEAIEMMSAERNVDAETPPAFLIHTLDDQAVVAENSILYMKALERFNIPAELHLYQSGGHGFGLGQTGTSKSWTKMCEEWLRQNVFLK